MMVKFAWEDQSVAVAFALVHRDWWCGRVSVPNRQKVNGFSHLLLLFHDSFISLFRFSAANPGYSCASGEICIGGSECRRDVCMCPDRYYIRENRCTEPSRGLQLLHLSVLLLLILICFNLISSLVQFIPRLLVPHLIFAWATLNVERDTVDVKQDLSFSTMNVLSRDRVILAFISVGICLDGG